MNDQAAHPWFRPLTLMSPLGIALALFVVFIIPLARGQYVGVTCGFSYSAQLEGPPSYPDKPNISMYNPYVGGINQTWDNWVEQLAQAGVDFVAPNLTGTNPALGGNNPTRVAPMLSAINNRGLTSTLKMAIFDDNAASWCAQWNRDHGRGFGYAQPMDMGDPNNWKYLYDYNYKPFYQTVPDANRFKIHGRPLIIIWTSGSTFCTNTQGNLSQALNYVRAKCQQDFGFNPYIIVHEDFLKNDTTCLSPGVVDGTHRWFGPPADGATLSVHNGVRTGVFVPQFLTSSNSGFLDPDHGALLDDNLRVLTGAGALISLGEGFTDYEESAAMWRNRNLDTNGAALGYGVTYYDYPNQRINLLRKHSRTPVPASMKFEAEGCDNYGGANGGNGLTNFYRNGNIAIQATSDVGGGWNVGWMQNGEWFEWKDVPLNGTPSFQLRIATAGTGLTAHLVIDGSVKTTRTLPNTGGTQVWTTFDLGTYGSFTGTHTVRIVFSNAGPGLLNFNWWQTAGATPITRPNAPVNIAQGKSVVASSVSNTNVAANAVDGTTRTRWASLNTDNEWIYVDLGSSQAIDGVTLLWEPAYARAYKIQTSNDASTWTDRYSTTTGNGGVDLIPFTATARYVRMLGQLRAIPYGFSLWEFEVNRLGGSTAKKLVPGTVVSLLANANSQYVCADNNGNGTLMANRLNAGLWERYLVVDAGSGNIALRSQGNNLYVCADSSGTGNLTANRTSIGLWETFTEVDAGNGKIALRAAVNNLYVCAESAGNAPLIPNRASIGAWEAFTATLAP